MFFTLEDAELGWFPAVWTDGLGLAGANLGWLALPGLLLTKHLLAGYVRYTRTEARESLREEYVRLVRMKGAGPVRVARHVFREAVVPLVTLFVTELLGVLLVSVFVLEVVFGVPGVGLLAYETLTGRQLQLTAALTVLFATVDILGNVVRDVAAATLDERYGS